MNDQINFRHIRFVVDLYGIHLAAHALKVCHQFIWAIINSAKTTICEVLLQLDVCRMGLFLVGIC